MQSQGFMLYVLDLLSFNVGLFYYDFPAFSVEPFDGFDWKDNREEEGRLQGKDGLTTK